MNRSTKRLNQGDVIKSGPDREVMEGLSEAMTSELRLKMCEGVSMGIIWVKT